MKAILVPIHKKGDINNIVNYRQISILSPLAKKIESILCDSKYKFVHSTLGSLTERQHGFALSKSTAYVFSNFCSDIIENKKQLDVIS